MPAIRRFLSLRTAVVWRSRGERGVLGMSVVEFVANRALLPG